MATKSQYEIAYAARCKDIKQKLADLLMIADPKKPVKEVSEKIGASKPSIVNWQERPEQMLLKHSIKIDSLHAENKSFIDTAKRLKKLEG